MKKLLSIVLSLCMLLSITSGLHITANADTPAVYLTTSKSSANRGDEVTVSVHVKAGTTFSGIGIDVVTNDDAYITGCKVNDWTDFILNMESVDNTKTKFMLSQAWLNDITLKNDIVIATVNVRIKNCASGSVVISTDNIVLSVKVDGMLQSVDCENHNVSITVPTLSQPDFYFTSSASSYKQGDVFTLSAYVKKTENKVSGVALVYRLPECLSVVDGSFSLSSKFKNFDKTVNAGNNGCIGVSTISANGVYINEDSLFYTVKLKIADNATCASPLDISISLSEVDILDYGTDGNLTSIATYPNVGDFPSIKLPHNLTYVAAKEGTCKANGNIAHYHCSACGKNFSDSQGSKVLTSVTASGSHKLTYVAAKKQTCNKSGNIAYYHCSVCGKNFSDKNGKNEVKNITVDPHFIDDVVEDYPCYYREVVYCTECGEIFYYDETYDDDNHTIDFSDGYITPATLTEDGYIDYYCVYCDIALDYDTIASIETIKLSKKEYVYDGKTKKPKVIVEDRYGNTIDSSNYKVSYAKGRKNVGKYKVTVKFNGEYYSGTKTLYFTINPKSTSISSVKSAKKGFTVKWKKQTTQTTGYQLQYSTDKNFKKDNKTVTLTKNSKNSKKITGLKSNKKYYVRVRTYKTVSGKKYYSSWSGKKTIVTK